MKPTILKYLWFEKLQIPSATSEINQILKKKKFNSLN